MQKDLNYEDQQQSSSELMKGVRPFGGTKKSEIQVLTRKITKGPTKQVEIIKAKTKKLETQQYHKTKLLLSIYRTVIWRIEYSVPLGKTNFLNS